MDYLYINKRCDTSLLDTARRCCRSRVIAVSVRNQFDRQWGRQCLSWVEIHTATGSSVSLTLRTFSLAAAMRSVAFWSLQWALTMPWPSFRYLNATGSTPPPPPPQSSTFKIKNIVCEVLFIGALCRHHRWASWLDNGDVILWCHDRRAFLLVNGGWCHDVSTKTPCDWIGVTQWCQTRKLLLLDHPHCHDLTKQRLFMLRILDRQQLWSDLFMYIVFLC